MTMELKYFKIKKIVFKGFQVLLNLNLKLKIQNSKLCGLWVEKYLKYL